MVGIKVHYYRYIDGILDRPTKSVGVWTFMSQSHVTPHFKAFNKNFMMLSCFPKTCPDP